MWTYSYFEQIFLLTAEKHKISEILVKLWTLWCSDLFASLEQRGVCSKPSGAVVFFIPLSTQTPLTGGIEPETSYTWERTKTTVLDLRSCLFNTYRFLQTYFFKKLLRFLPIPVQPTGSAPKYWTGRVILGCFSVCSLIASCVNLCFVCINRFFDMSRNSIFNYIFGVSIINNWNFRWWWMMLEAFSNKILVLLKCTSTEMSLLNIFMWHSLLFS